MAVKSIYITITNNDFSKNSFENIHKFIHLDNEIKTKK